MHVGHYCNYCDTGKFGHNCESDCPEECMTCDLNGNCIICKPEYFGLNCKCPKGCHDNKCDKWTGHCKRCKPFFKWPCTHCVDGKYGINCDKDCPDKCLSCSSDTNCTKCKDGFYGESGKCDYGCNKGYYGKYCDKRCPLNCLNSTCFVENGSCSHSCVDGYHGKSCECPMNCICDRLGHCSRCVDDIFYGPLCDQVCSYFCFNRTCDILTGTCNRACKHGYFGNKCDRICSSDCGDLSCDRDTGLCDFGKI
jgi:hypothetical protein